MVRDENLEEKFLVSLDAFLELGPECVAMNLMNIDSEFARQVVIYIDKWHDFIENSRDHKGSRCVITTGRRLHKLKKPWDGDLRELDFECGLRQAWQHVPARVVPDRAENFRSHFFYVCHECFPDAPKMKV